VLLKDDNEVPYNSLYILFWSLLRLDWQSWVSAYKAM
jgi:hypothetical protein